MSSRPLHPKIVDVARRLRENDPTLVSCCGYGDMMTHYDEAILIASALHHNTTLRQLSLCYCNIGIDGVTAIAAALRTNTTLAKIDLEGNRLGAEGASLIATALQANTSLKTLNLSNNNIGNDGAKAIGLESNTTLERVYMLQNPIGETGKGYTHLYIYREANKKRVVQKMIHHELPDGLFPHVIGFLSRNDQHVNKLFCILSERPELVKDAV
eukprot:scaffold81831_cov46-Attheya_sp.AAC.4